MPKWTKEQLSAIEQTGTNIIVSAGAGSGKTAVLTERVIHKLRQGVKLNELLILTFTNAAAKEMKERIRQKITDDDELKDNLADLESAYITTFDSFSLSLVKKYHYITNVSSNINIIDSGLISLLEDEYLDEVFNEYYDNFNEQFNNLIDTFTIKNDTNLKKYILNIINSLKLIVDKKSFLDNYFKTYLTDDLIDKYVNDYVAIIKEEISNIELNIEYIKDYNIEYGSTLETILDHLINASTYEDILNSINVSVPRRPKDSTEVKEYKESIDKSLKNIKSYLMYASTKDIKDTLLSTKDYIRIILEIIDKFYQKMNDYKFKNDVYEFNDIEIMAINILHNNKDILEEVKNTYKEICIDEYQDTNDLQEEFIKLIENNNVYMVGDIKQSIYRFRNANPEIFKNKYNMYKDNNNGIKIDLLKNFRSRKEVINAINLIFSSIMDESVGAVDYNEGHTMEFGNTSYEEIKNNKQSYDLKILNYNKSDDYTQDEIEAFIIAKDIINKVHSGYQVVDKRTNSLRRCRYEDFCIIMDRGTTFPLIQKIFNYLNIPINVYKDRVLTNETDLKIINNIIDFIFHIKDNNFNEDFTYDFLSIARSYLSDLQDAEIFEIVKNKSYQNTDIYKISLNISAYLDLLNSTELLTKIITDFNFYQNILKTANIEDKIVRIDNLYKIIDSLNNLNFTIYDLHDYITSMLNSAKEITYKVASDGKNAVKLMNIHVSKGLEFPICYYAGLSKEFNKQDVKDRFLFDNTLGIITPYFKDGIGSTILKTLLKCKYNKEDISEKIRLFYVALTRAKEKIILVTNLNREEVLETGVVDLNIKLKYNSFISMLNSINYKLSKYITNINIEDLHISKDYLYNRSVDNKLITNNNEVINFQEVNIENNIVESKHASKEINELITKEERKLLDYGTKMHQVLEMTDFKHIPANSKYYNILNNFVKLLDIQQDTKIYKEIEFSYIEDNTTYNGVIDLVLEEDNVVKIVDYKLKNIDDPKYINQLKVYYNYISKCFNKDIFIYLYSIYDNVLKEVIIKEY